MDTTTLAYLAGFVDGEGSIAINTRTYRSGGELRTGGSLRLSVHQLDPRPIRLLAETFGGSVRRHGYRKMAEKRDLFEWHISSEQAYAAIKAMRPWLIVKDEQADLGMQFQEMLRSRDVPRTTRLSSEEQAAREAIHQELRRLKWKVYEAVGDEEAPPAPPKPKRVPLHKTKLPSPRSTMGRTGRPALGESRMPDAATLEAEYRSIGGEAVAAKYGVSKQSVYNWLAKYGISKNGLTPEVRARMSEGLRRSWHAKP